MAIWSGRGSTSTALDLALSRAIVNAFRMHDHHRGKVLIKANRNTRYKGLHNFRDLFVGMRVEVKAHRKNGRWIANRIERRGPPISPP